MIVKPLEQVVASTLQRGTSKINRVIEKVGGDCASFTKGTKLVSNPTKDDIDGFIKLFTAYFVEVERKKMKNPNSFLSRIQLKVGEPISIKIQQLLSKALKTEVLKDYSGKVIGGFNYHITGGKMGIVQMVLEPSKHNTKEGISLLLQMAKRIKELAVESNAKFITCEVAKKEEHVANLYKRVGFKKDCGSHMPVVSRMQVSTEDFCKKYL